MKDIHARVPVDRLAARVVMFTGEHFEPNKKVCSDERETPHEIAEITEAMRLNPNFTNLTGIRFGRFTVIGLCKTGGMWCVRCDCGKYATRKKKAVMNKENVQDRCEHCRHLAFLQRDEYKRRTGKDVDIRNF